MSKDRGIKDRLQMIELTFNNYLEEIDGNFSNTRFILTMNKFLSQFPKEISSKYRWKRRGLKNKPTLYLENLNVIIQFVETQNRYITMRSHNLDVFI